MTEKNCFVLRDAIYNSIIRHFYIKQWTADAGHEPQEKWEYCGIIDMFIIPPTEIRQRWPNKIQMCSEAAMSVCEAWGQIMISSVIIGCYVGDGGFLNWEFFLKDCYINLSNSKCWNAVDNENQDNLGVSGGGSILVLYLIIFCIINILFIVLYFYVQ